MSVKEEIQIWSMLILSGVWDGVSRILNALNSPDSRSATVMSFVWLFFAFIWLIIYIVRSIRNR